MVDLTGFIGAVDWRSVFAVRTLAAWGKNGTGISRTAYVVRNETFGAVIKVVRAVLFNSSHRSFDNFEDAMAWLELPG